MSFDAKKIFQIKPYVIETLSFIAKNVFLLGLFWTVSFIASFLSLKYVFRHQALMLTAYGVFCYIFYYIWTALYYEQKPLFTSEKLVNSILKTVIIFAISVFVIVCGHLFLILLKYMARWLIGFPDIYENLKNCYHFLNSSKIGQFLLYIPTIFLLTFTLFIPAMSWVSSVNGKDMSLWGAYARTQGNYLKISAVLIVVYGMFPFILNLLIPQTLISLSVTHAFVSILQFVFYLRLYDFFYEDLESALE